MSARRMSPEVLERRRLGKRRYHNLCYAAEYRAGVRRWRTGEPTITPREARALFDEITATLGMTATLSFYNGGDGRGWARYHKQAVSLSRHYLRASTVLHEIAHLMSRQSGHGRRFRHDYMTIAERWMPSYAASLRQAFQWYRLDYSDPGPEAPMVTAGQRVRITKRQESWVNPRMGEVAEVLETIGSKARLQFATGRPRWVHEFYFTPEETAP